MFRRILLSMVLMASISLAQQSLSIQPKSFGEDLLRSSIPVAVMPTVDVNQLLWEDAQPGVKAYRFGFKHEVSLTPENSGQWDVLENGDSIWRLAIESRDAYNLRVFFGNLDIPQGAMIHAYTESNGEFFGAYTHENNNLFFSTPLIEGDNCVIEYYKPSNVSHEGNIEIIHIVHDYRNFYELMENNSRDECGANVVCPQADPYQPQIDATSHLDLGWSICSGAMINNTSQDLTPYYLTADHCVEGSYPSQYRFYFNYETSSCNGSWAAMGSYAYGSTLKWTSNGFNGNDITSGNDLTLLEISGAIYDSWNVYYAGWNVNTSSSQSTSVGVHHPQGEPKQISFTSGTAYTNSWATWGTHWKVYWDEGGTEPGSSGSPLFDSSGRIIGPLSGGPDVPCGSSSDHALYGKLNYAWSNIDQYLDPTNSGVSYLSGTYDSVVTGCTDPNADNYNPNATQDDGSCEYSTVGDAILTFGTMSGNSIEIILQNSVPVGGFQFVVSDSPDILSLIEATGGTATDEGFLLSTSEAGTVLGFSMTGATIPAGVSTLLNLSYSGSGDTELCLSDGIVSDANGDGLSINYGECYSFSGGIPGDVTGDGIVNILDVVQMVNIVLGSMEPTPAQFAAADLNSDGVVNILDIVSVVNIILG
jgi:hypothetical protein